MSAVETLEAPELLTLTESAVAKVYELIADEGNMNLKLRIFVQGGGCSGFTYGFTFEESAQEDDFLIEKNIHGFTIGFLVDVMSSQYLQGATIDYEEELMGSRFVIRNPNAQTTCGCGSSFGV